MTNNTQLSPIRSSGDHKEYKPKTGLHAHSHYEILLILKGGGIHIIEDKEYPVLDHQVFFLKPTQKHFFQPHRLAKFLFLAIDSEILSSHTSLYLRDFDFFQNSSRPSFIQNTKLSSIASLFRDIQSELEHKKTNHNVLLTSLITTLLVKLQRIYHEHHPIISSSNKTSTIHQTFFRLLSDPNFKSRFVKDFAENCFLNPNYFNIMIKKSTGFSASYWIQQQTIIDAKRALLHTSHPITQIAQDLGFKNATHFTRFFKHIVKKTPIQFRKT